MTFIQQSFHRTHSCPLGVLSKAAIYYHAFRFMKQMGFFIHLITTTLPITNSLLMSMLTRADQGCKQEM